MPTRINRVIELLEQNQPIYNTGTHDLSYENGKAMSQTWGDYIGVEMEHGSFDMSALDNFMRGLVDGGPTPSGHRTPPVIMTIPTDGTSEQVIRANAWMMKQCLARGVHGILLCHAETPDAVRAFVESCRYPFQTQAVGDQLAVGRRGGGGQRSAAHIWGVDPQQYMKLADPWPLNPNGELFLGLKLENTRALANCEASAAIPGIAFAEWGPGDMGLSFGYPDAHDPPYPADLDKARLRVKAACDNANIAFLCGWNDFTTSTEARVRKLMNDGVKILSGVGEDGAAIGRALTNRTMPV